MTTLRIHPPAGKLEPGDWLKISQEAQDKADGFVYLCENSAFEIRNLNTDVDAELLGLHSAIVLYSPLSGPARALASEVALRLPKPELESGNFSEGAGGTARVGIDCGDGDVARLGLEICVKLNGTTADIEIAGKEICTDVVLSDVCEAVCEQISHAKSQLSTDDEAGNIPPTSAELLGWLPSSEEEGRVSLGAAVVDGAIPAAYAEMIGRMEVATTITPWGSLVFHDLLEGDADVVLRFLAPRGFIFDANSPLLTP